MKCPCCKREGYKESENGFLTPPNSRNIERYWSRVIKFDGCWIFTGNASHDYGRMKFGGKHMLAHVIAWVLANGPVKSGMIIAHSCDNKRCVKLEHLSEKTNAQNVQEGYDRGLNVGLKGEKNHQSKLSNAKSEEIREHLKNGTKTIKQIAAEEKVSFQLIYRIGLNQNRASVDGPVIKKRVRRYLSPAEVTQIRQWCLDPEVTQKQIAKIFGIHQATVSGIHIGASRRDIPVLNPQIRLHPLET